MKRLYLDIETCPNVVYCWSAGFKINISHDSILEERRIITAAWKWGLDGKTHAIRWGRDRMDDNLMEPLLNEMNSADEIVAHYGDGFDIPWVRTRALYHGIVTPIWKSVDTKAWSSKYFYLNSNKLDYLARFLGIGTKIRTEYDLWKDATGGSDKKSKAAVDKMVAYNEHDSVLLAPVHSRLSLYCPAHTHEGVLEGKPKWTCPRCAGENVRQVKRMVSAAGMLKFEMHCKDCPKYYMINNAAYKLYVRQKPHSAR